MPRSTGASQPWCPAYTDTRYSPRGFATARMATLKRRICNHPLMVMSESLGAQERVDQVEQDRDGNSERDDRFGAHGRDSPEEALSSATCPSRAQPATYANMSAKNASVPRT